MPNSFVLHVVGCGPLLSDQIARAAIALSYRPVVHDGIDELCASRPERGVIFLKDGPIGDFAEASDYLNHRGISLPMVAMGEGPPITHVVMAMKAGALDYLQLPICPHHLSVLLERIIEEAEAMLGATSVSEKVVAKRNCTPAARGSGLSQIAKSQARARASRQLINTAEGTKVGGLQSFGLLSIVARGNKGPLG